MATQVVMPKLSPTMEEGQLSRWLKKEGDKVSVGEGLAEIDTDKATMEAQALTSGVLRKILVPEGETVPLGSIIAIIGEPDEDISGLLPKTSSGAPQSEKKEPVEEKARRERPAELPPRAVELQPSQFDTVMKDLAEIAYLLQKNTAAADRLSSQLQKALSVQPLGPPAGPSVNDDLMGLVMQTLHDLLKEHSHSAEELKRWREATDIKVEQLLSILNEPESSQQSTAAVKRRGLTAVQDKSHYFDVFLSYSSSDQVMAERIHAAVANAGGHIFMASKIINPGERFPDEIRTALAEAKEIWMLVSPHSLESDWVRTEWGAAWALNKKVVPILFRCDIKSLPQGIASSIHCIDFHDYEKLVRDTFPTTRT